jgi:hypothetical protein
MSYTINKTDGSVLTEIVDGTIDQSATDLTLIGKNALSYGEAFNENFVKILENFSSTTAPSNPITGQLWYDTSESRLKIYNGSSFKVAGGTIVSNTAPSSITQGDIWIDSTRQQLYFNDGVATRLAGPQYTAAQGLSGFNITTIIDINGLSNTVAMLYVGNTLLGIFSRSTFYPGTPIPGFGTTSILINGISTTVSKQVVTGYTASESGGIFTTTASISQSLLAADGSLRTAESFLSGTVDSATSGTLSILNTTPLILGTGGTNGTTEVKVSSNSFQINALTSNQTLQFNLIASSGALTTAFHINGTSKYVGIYTPNPQATLHVGAVGDTTANVIIEGSLTVKGTTTTVNTTNLQISDKLIEIGYSASPTNTTANGGGISLLGTTNKTIIWSTTGSNWTSSEHWNLATGKAYKINASTVLDASSVYSTSAPNLTSVGTLTSLRVANLSISTDNVISYFNTINGNGNVVIQPKGTGTVDVTNSVGGRSNITSVAEPLTNTDAATKYYVDSTVKNYSLATHLNTSGLINAQIATNLITKIFPPAEHLLSTDPNVYAAVVARVTCYDQGTTVTVTAGSFSIGKVYIIVGAAGTTWTDIGSPTNNVGQVFTATGLGSGTGTAAAYLRQFLLNTSSGTWAYQQDL